MIGAGLGLSPEPPGRRCAGGQTRLRHGRRPARHRRPRRLPVLHARHRPLHRRHEPLRQRDAAGAGVGSGPGDASRRLDRDGEDRRGLDTGLTARARHGSVLAGDVRRRFRDAAADRSGARGGRRLAVHLLAVRRGDRSPLCRNRGAAQTQPREFGPAEGRREPTPRGGGRGEHGRGHLSRWAARLHTDASLRLRRPVPS